MISHTAQFLWIMTGVASLIGYSQDLNAAPPREIPFGLYNAYTMDGRAYVKSWYFDNSYSPSEPVVYNSLDVQGFIAKAKRREENYYGATDTFLYTMLDKYPEYIRNKSIGVIGSTVPWYESVVLAYSGIPTTVEYNKIVCQDLRLRAMTVEEYRENPIQFDSILSISSIEHDGLGRYGDPIDPNGDLRAMKELKAMLKPGGLLFFAVPVGPDCIYWNAHRVYGPIRLPLLLEGWEIVDSCGFSTEDYLYDRNSGHQPVFVLRKAEEAIQE